METFGEYIKKKRVEKKISLREFAMRIEITPSYMSDIENGRRNAPDKIKIDAMAQELGIYGENIEYLYDLASESRNEAPVDLKNMLKESENSRIFLRTAKKLDFNEEDFKNLIEKIKDYKK